MSFIWGTVIANWELNLTRSILLWTRTANSSSSVQKPAYSWQKSGQTKLLKPSVSLTGSFFSNWSLTRQISTSSQCTHLKWADLNIKRNISTTSCYYQGPSHWDTYSSWWLERQIGPPACVFSNAHDGQGFSTRNVEGAIIMEFAISKGIHVANTWLKNIVRQLIIYSSSSDSTQQSAYSMARVSAVHSATWFK